MFSVYDKTWTLRASYFMPSLVRVRVSERLTHNNNNNNNKKKIWLVYMADKFTVGTPNTLEKVWILMLKENIGNLAACFKTLNGTMELSQKA